MPAGDRKDTKERENGMLDQTLSYAHRPGRIDITVHKIGESSAATYNTDSLNNQQGGGTGPFHAPIFMHSFCKVSLLRRITSCFSFVLDCALWYLTLKKCNRI